MEFAGKQVQLPWFLIKMCSTDHLVEEIGKYLQYIK